MSIFRLERGGYEHEYLEVILRLTRFLYRLFRLFQLLIVVASMHLFVALLFISEVWSARITESLNDASNVSHDGFQCPPECISVFCLGQGGVFELTPVPIDSSYALAQEPNALSFL